MLVKILYYKLVSFILETFHHGHDKFNLFKIQSEIKYLGTLAIFVQYETLIHIGTIIIYLTSILIDTGKSTI